MPANTDADTLASDFDAFLLLLGRLNYAWTNTESLLIHLIAGLAGTDKETAVVIFLTLNTTRARVDLVERLAKMPQTSKDQQERVLALTGQIIKVSALRNRYSHSIYSFDPDGGTPKTILMRIADRKNEIRMGRSEDIDADVLSKVEQAIAALRDINTDIWALIRDFDYPA